MPREGAWRLKPEGPGSRTGQRSLRKQGPRQLLSGGLGLCGKRPRPSAGRRGELTQVEAEPGGMREERAQAWGRMRVKEV